MLLEYLNLLSYAALLISCAMLVVFGLALLLEDNSIVDIAYGPLFVLVTWTVAFFWSDWSWRQLILLGLITLWGMRLGIRIFLKNWRKPEDFRYRSWRTAWQQNGMLYFFFRSLGQIYLLQGAVVLGVLTPVLVAFSQPQSPLLWFNWAGVILWLIGFFFETIGDFQLDRFVKKSENQGKLMMSGLWRFTRHPNYFGEATMWWGIWLIIVGMPLTQLALLSPFIITTLLLKVSGIPMLEAKWEGRPDWEEYKKKTSAFFPWFPKKMT